MMEFWKEPQANALSLSSAIQSVICRLLLVCSEINTKRKRIKNNKKKKKGGGRIKNEKTRREKLIKKTKIKVRMFANFL